MDLAIVIPAYNEARTIRGIAEEALRQAACVIIVDDGSTDATSDALAGLPVTLVRNGVKEAKVLLAGEFHDAVERSYLE